MITLTVYRRAPPPSDRARRDETRVIIITCRATGGLPGQRPSGPPQLLLHPLVAVDPREGFRGLQRPDGVVEEGEHVAGVGVEHVLVAHHVDDGVWMESLRAEFQQVLDELPFGVAGVEVVGVLGIEEVLGEIEESVAGGVVEARQPLAGVEHVHRRPLERPFRDRGVELGDDLPVVLQVDLVRDGHGCPGYVGGGQKRPDTASV